MTNSFDNNDDDNNDDFTPEQAHFLKENFKPGEYAMLTILVKLPQLEEFIGLMYDSGLDLAVAGNAKQKEQFNQLVDDDDGEEPMRGNTSTRSEYDN